MTTSEKTKKTAHLHLRMCPALKEKLVKLAEEDGRSLTNYLTNLFNKLNKLPNKRRK